MLAPVFNAVHLLFYHRATYKGKAPWNNGKINMVYNINKITEVDFPTKGLKGPTRSKTETGNSTSDERITRSNSSVNNSLRTNEVHVATNATRIAAALGVPVDELIEQDIDAWE